MKSKEFFPDVFSRHAESYQRRLEDIMASGEARGRTRVIELADARPGMRILDLACGPGNLSRRLAAMVAPGGEVVGVDLSRGMIDLARRAGIPNARFDLMDMERLEFAGASFDAAVCGHGFQFVPDLGRALSEARRVLRSPGRLADLDDQRVDVRAVRVGDQLLYLRRRLDAVVESIDPERPILRRSVDDRTRTWRRYRAGGDGSRGRARA